MKKRLLLILGAAILFAPGCYWVVMVNITEVQGQTIVFEYRLPEGFTGWVTIKHGVPNAPPIPFAPAFIGGTHTFDIPPSGYLETSSPVLQVRHQARFFRGDAGWDPPPFFLRETSTKICEFIFVPQKALSNDEDTPPEPELGCI